MSKKLKKSKTHLIELTEIQVEILIESLEEHLAMSAKYNPAAVFPVTEKILKTLKALVGK